MVAHGRRTPSSPTVFTVSIDDMSKTTVQGAEIFRRRPEPDAPYMPIR